MSGFSIIVKAHKDAGAKKELIGKSCGGNITKIHVAIDAPGNPLKIMLNSGQVLNLDK